MRNSKHQAQYLIAKFNRAIELSLNIPEYETWADASEDGNSYLHNIKSCLERHPNKHESPFEILNNIYKYCLSEVRSLVPDEDYIPFNEFKEVIDKLPENINPKIFQTLTPKDKEKFGFSIWGAFEECEILFDLGDDGTDEMEQQIELLGIIVTQFQPTADLSESAFLLILEMLAHEEHNISLHGFMPSIYMFLNFTWYLNLLEYARDYGVTYNSYLTLFFDKAETEYLQPYYNQTTHPTILCLSNPELDLMIEAIQFYFDETCHDTTDVERALKQSIEDKLQMELYARHQIL